MAISPSPFFFPTTAPAYAPTTVFSPPPFGFGAPAYGYPASPFPYPPPASVYMPASGFSPNWPTWPPPAPDPPTPDHVPVHHNSSGCPIHSLHHHHFRPTSDQLLVQAAPQPTATPTAPNREHQPPQSYASSSTLSMVNANHRFFSEDDAAVQAVADERVPAKDATLHRLQHELCNIQPRMDQQQARERTSFDTIKGELAKLTSMAAQLAVSIGKQSSAAASSLASSLSSPVGASSVVTTPTIAYVSATSASTLPSATAYTALQVFGEMPQQYDFHNLSHKIVFLGDGSERSYFALPENYPLERATPEPVFDVYGDETEDCSNAFVDVSASTPEQQPYEEDQRETEQPPKCFSRPNFSPERPIVGTVGVFSLTNEQSTGELDTLNESNNLLFAKQNIEQLLICSSTAPQCSTYEEESQGDEKILWEKPVCQTATGHSISFFPWDPGATAFSVLFPTVANATKLQCTYVYNPELVHVLAENLGAQAAPIFASATVCYLACERGWTVVNASAELVLAVQISEATSVAKHALFLLSQDNSFIVQRAAHLSESLTWHGSLPGTPFLLLNITNYTWDPGVSKLKDTVLDKCAVQVQFVQQSTELSLFSLEFSTSSQKRVQWDPRVKVSLYCWLNILTVWSEIATPFWQNQGISASYVWDPGTMLLWYKAKWWLLFTEEKISCHGDIKCYGVALWLIHFQPP